MKDKEITFNGEEYFKRIDGKDHYIWDIDSPFGNSIPVKVIKEGSYAEYEMGRPISAVLLIFKIKNEYLREMVALDGVIILKDLILEINNIVDYRINQLKNEYGDTIKAVEAHFVPTEFYEDKVNFRFFLSEIFKENDKELGFFIELVRAAEHIKNLYILLMRIPSEDIIDEIQGIHWDSVRLFIMNIAVSQLSEVFKFLGRLEETVLFNEIRNDLSKRGKKALVFLQEKSKDFMNDDSFIRKVLKPMRNITYHYDPNQAFNWGKERMKMETIRKPHYTTIILSDQTMRSFYGPGFEFDENILYKYMIMGLNEPFKAQQEIIHCQEHYLYFVRSFCNVLLKKNKITPDRTNDDFFKFWHGYKRNEE